LLPKLGAVQHQVHHPMYIGMCAWRHHYQDEHMLMLPAMQAQNGGEQWSVFVYLCHTACLTLLRLLPHFFERMVPCSAQQVSFSHAPRPVLTYILHRPELANWRAGPNAENNFCCAFTS
jgi:hypothetical protein